MKLPPHIRWPAFIAGALALQVLASLVTIYLATSNPSYAVEDDYYRKALAWDAKRAQDHRNLELGWTLRFEITSATVAGDRAVLSVDLGDAAGSPVDGALLDVEAFHNARADDLLRARLDGHGNGRYSAPLPITRQGVWELRFVAERGDDRFTHTETRYVALGGR
jgi:nitrogen fixation protein FixH